MRALLLLLTLLLSGCAVKTWTLEGPSDLSNGLTVRVEMNRWKYYPSDLDRYVLPIYIEIENRGSQTVKVAREDVFLIDEKGNQYNPVEPRDVISMLGRDYRMGIGLGFGYWSSPFGLWWSPYYTFPRNESYPDIVNRAFIFGEVQGGARLRGFVYFPEIPRDINKLTLNVKGYKFRLKAKED
ncbi:MAG: hypothetical protein ACK42C_08440 [Aquificaceae bacterium]|jgi:hypothetical protein|uniref:hypothetical protein n=1 Tax=Hydrogenobacter sp. Uz 6-8 TaxID=3384828 RepID=UPI000F10B717|nr:MAG: hypothetical protein D6804_07860 [Aquificota bacterium]